MSTYWRDFPDDPDVVPCGRCGKDVVLDHDPPCEHGLVACPECQHPSVCPDCRREAFMHMCETGVYDPAADALFDHTAPESVDRVKRDGGYSWDGGWTEVKRDG